MIKKIFDSIAHPQPLPLGGENVKGAAPLTPLSLGRSFAKPSGPERSSVARLSNGPSVEWVVFALLLSLSCLSFAETPAALPPAPPTPPAQTPVALDPSRVENIYCAVGVVTSVDFVTDKQIQNIKIGSPIVEVKYDSERRVYAYRTSKSILIMVFGSRWNIKKRLSAPPRATLCRPPRWIRVSRLFRCARLSTKGRKLSFLSSWK